MYIDSPLVVGNQFLASCKAGSIFDSDFRFLLNGKMVLAEAQHRADEDVGRAVVESANEVE
jgi:hypothetical protein